MATLLLVRHGETDWNALGRLQGHTDRPLNDDGRRQAAALAERLAGDGVAAVYASDLARARETAEIVAARLELPVTVDRDLRERNWGTWEGLTPAERHAGERVLVVTHGGSMRRLQAAVLGVALPVVENCEIWACVHEGGTFRAID